MPYALQNECFIDYTYPMFLGKELDEAYAGVCDQDREQA
jgi:hypothetical protein